MVKFVAKNWKVIGKILTAVAGTVLAVGCAKSVIDETCYETRELGELVTEENNEEEDMF